MKFQNATPVSPDAIRPLRFQSGCVVFGREFSVRSIAAFSTKISGSYLPEARFRDIIAGETRNKFHIFNFVRRVCNTGNACIRERATKSKSYICKIRNRYPFCSPNTNTCARPTGCMRGGLCDRSHSHNRDNWQNFNYVRGSRQQRLCVLTFLSSSSALYASKSILSMYPSSHITHTLHVVR